MKEIDREYLKFSFQDNNNKKVKEVREKRELF
jgi:hypothetical protein